MSLLISQNNNFFPNPPSGIWHFRPDGFDRLRRHKEIVEDHANPQRLHNQRPNSQDIPRAVRAELQRCKEETVDIGELRRASDFQERVQVAVAARRDSTVEGDDQKSRR